MGAGVSEACWVEQINLVIRIEDDFRGRLEGLWRGSWGRMGKMNVLVLAGASSGGCGAKAGMFVLVRAS